MEKTIGFIGVGKIGASLARHFAFAGYDVILSNSRGKDSLVGLAEGIGPRARAAESSDALAAEVIVLSVPWSKLEFALQNPAAWEGKIVIDTTNNIISTNPSLQLADLHGRTSGERVAELLPSARIVKAFNTLFYKILQQPPRENMGSRVIAFSGDDAQAKTVVAGLITAIGFIPLDLGSLKDGGQLQEVGATFSSVNLIKVDGEVQQAKEVVLRGIMEIQSAGHFEIFEEIFSPDFVDHTPQPGGFSADRESVKRLYKMLRSGFPDFRADVHWQIADGGKVTTFKTYHGTHLGEIFGLQPTGKKIHFESVDVMQVHNGQITDHWGAGNLLSLFQQLGAIADIKSE